MKKKIIQCFSNMGCGGAEAFIMNVYRNIDRDKYEFTFILNNSKDGFYVEEIKKLGGKIIYISSPYKNFGINYILEFYKILKQEEYSAIHSHLLSLDGINLFIAKIIGIKIRMSHCHTTKYGKKENALRKIKQYFLKKLVLISSNHNICCSEEAGIFFYGFKNYKVLKNGINLKEYTKEDTKDYKKKFKFNKNGGSTVGIIARLIPLKNHKFIFEIIKEINKNMKDKITLIVVGSGYLEEELKKWVSENMMENEIIFLGVRSDISELLKALDILFLPSIYEGLPVTLIESQAAGVQALVSDNVSKECDLGVGLIEFLKLDKEVWIKKILEIIFSKNMNINYKKNNVVIEKNGYDIKNTVNILEKIYARN